MRSLALGALIVGGLIIQSTVFSYIQIGHVKPDLLLIMVVSYGLIYGRDEGVVIGFFSGLIQDLLTGPSFGLNTLAKMLIGLFAGMTEKEVFKENILLPSTALFLATFGHEFFVFIGTQIMDTDVAFFPLLFRTILPLAVYNSILAPFVYSLLHRLGKTPLFNNRR